MGPRILVCVILLPAVWGEFFNLFGINKVILSVAIGNYTCFEIVCTCV